MKFDLQWVMADIRRVMPLFNKLRDGVRRLFQSKGNHDH